MKFSLQYAAAAPPAPAKRAEFPPLAGADIAGMIQGDRVGGDLYHFVRANQSRVLFGLLDVAGRREENFRIVEAARQTIQVAGVTRFVREEINEAEAMMELCLELNLCIRRTAAGVHSCAAFLGCYNESIGTVCYVNAGHTPGLLRDAGGITELPATGLPLGLFSASTYEAPTAALPEGTALLLVSRGVVEAAHRKQEFGLERVKQHLGTSSRRAASEMAGEILFAVQQFTGHTNQNDITALALVRNSTMATANA